jgi:hypothetical protein
VADTRRDEVGYRAGYRCEYCGYPEAASSTPLEVDHIVPEAKGGPSTLDNLALCCRGCNLHQYVKTEAFDAISGVTVSLFHPRRQQWSEHFLLDRSTGIIHGSTSTGRATVEALGLNAVHALATRRLLIQLGLI